MWDRGYAASLGQRKSVVHVHSNGSKNKGSSRDSRLPRGLADPQNQSAQNASPPGDIIPEWRARSSRNEGRLQIGTPGRHRRKSWRVSLKPWITATHDRHAAHCGFAKAAERVVEKTERIKAAGEHQLQHFHRCSDILVIAEAAPPCIDAEPVAVQF
jgi:hypothetical protein